MAAASKRSFKILLVEDNPADAHLVERALRKSHIAPHLTILEDGAEALDFLRRKGEHEDAARPDLVLLDLNIPGKEGHEVLGELRNDPDMKELPIIIYTSSNTPKDVKTSYRLGANAHVRKPVDMESFFEVVASIESFWLKTATLPTP